MLRAAPHGIFSWDFTVYDAAGSPVAEIDMAAFREKAEVMIGEVACRVYREGWMSGPFVLESGGHVLMRAVKPSAFRRSFDLAYDDCRYTLRARSAFGRTFVLLEEERLLGTVAPDHAFTRKLTAELPEAMPLAVRVFILWLVILLWKRAAEAATSG